MLDRALVTGGLVIALLMALLAPASGGAESSRRTAAEPSRPSSLMWRPCSDGAAGVECATLWVPVIPQRPDGPTLPIRLARVPAAGPGTPLGSLVIEPGGPGISGVRMLKKTPDQLATAVHERYDVVAFDPRGVGGSRPVWCLGLPAMKRYLGALSAVQWNTSGTGRSVERWKAHTRAFGQGCERRVGPVLLRHLGTRAAAHDLDRIRAALGEQQLNYLGWSYGTKLGAVYADLYPRRVGRFVLDSAIDPSLTITQFNRGQARALELALNRFHTYCRESPSCPLPPGKRAATDRLRGFIQGLPPRGGDASHPTSADAMSALATAMYTPSKDFPVLRRALAAAMRGDGRLLVELGGQYGSEDPDSNFRNALYAINCFDSPATPNARTTARMARRWERFAPIFGSRTAWEGLRCHHFPTHARTPPRPVTAREAAPILIIGAERDAATPLVWSRALARQLQSARLIVADTDAHAVYPGNNRCVYGRVNDYLLADVVPAPRTSRCPADPKKETASGRLGTSRPGG